MIHITHLCTYSSTWYMCDTTYTHTRGMDPPRSSLPDRVLAGYACTDYIRSLLCCICFITHNKITLTLLFTIRYVRNINIIAHTTHSCVSVALRI